MNNDSADVLATSVKAIVSNATSLGISWNLRIATIVSNTSTGGITAIFDGDTVPISMVNATGDELSAGARVYVIMLASQGNFIMGYVNRSSILPRGDIFLAATAVDSTASAAFVNYSGPQSITLTKVSSSTRIVAQISGTAFVTIAGTGVEFGVLENGVDYLSTAVNRPVNTMLNAHTPFAGGIAISGLSRGSHTFTLRWRAVGGGTVNVDNNDSVAFSVFETP